ncbi:MAG: NAD kinase [bacterium]
MTYTIISKDCADSKDLQKVISKKLQLKEDENNPDIIIVIGGDGTILRAIHQYSDILDNVIIFGIHTGHLGFLTNYKKDDVNDIIDLLNNSDKIQVEEHSLLEYKFESNDGIKTGIALNEVTITSAPNMITLDVVVDEKILETFRGGGLCISTPLGSTGYNKSLGGAVIDHNIPCIQVTEIAGINSNSYKTLQSSLLLSVDRKILIKGNSEFGLFTYDNKSHRVDSFKSLEVKLSNRKVRLAYNSEINFVNRVNKSFL